MKSAETYLTRSAQPVTRRTLIGAMGLGAGALFLAGCGNTGQGLASYTGRRVTVAPGVPGPPVGSGVAGGSITVGWQSEGNSLDPALGYNLTAWDAICNCITAPPLIFGADGSGPYPNAAESIISNHDRSVYTVRFRDGVRFQNGRAVTAADYVYSWERLLDPQLASWASSYLYPIAGAEALFNKKAKSLKGVTIVDPLTVRIQLEGPTLTFPYLLAEPYMAAVPREVVEKYGSNFSTNVISTGPFTLDSYNENDQTCSFVANRHYFWSGLPYLDRITYTWGSSAQTELLQLQHGDIQSIGDGIGASLTPLVYSESSMEKYVYEVELPAVLWVGLNLEREPFTDVRVRQALNYAVDRDLLARITYGTGSAWGLPFPKVLPDFDRTAQPYTYNPERAKALLRATGREDLSFQLISTADGSNPAISQVLQQQFLDVGVKMSIDTVSDGAYDTATEYKNFAAAPVDWYQVEPTALDILTSNFTSDASSNYWNYSNKRVDALANKALSASTRSESNSYLAQCEEVIKQDAPGIFLESLNFVDGRSPELENFHYNVFYGTYYDRLWTPA